MNFLRFMFFALSNADKFLEAANQVKEFVEWLQEKYGDEKTETAFNSCLLDELVEKFPEVAKMCDECDDVRTRETAFNGRRGVLGDLIRLVLQDPERILNLVNQLIELFNPPEENFGLEGDE